MKRRGADRESDPREAAVRGGDPPSEHVAQEPPGARSQSPDDDRQRSGALTFQRIRDLVEHCAELHRTMGEILQERSEEAADEKERILLQTIGKTEIELADELTESFRRVRENQERDRREAEKWIQSTPASLVDDAERRCERLRTLTTAELDHEARAASRALTRFFEELQATAPTENQQELLQGLSEIESRYDRRHSTTVDASLV